jgi:peroxiredoxin Q/BCP
MRNLASIGLSLLASWTASGADLKPGDAAPDFTLVGSDGRSHTLAALRGKAVVLAWFPKAATSG